MCWIFSVEHMYSLFSFTFEAYLPWYAFKVDCIWKICSSFRVSSFSIFLSILSDHALKEVAKLAHTIDMFWKLIIIWKCMLHFGRDFFFKFCHLCKSPTSYQRALIFKSVCTFIFNCWIIPIKSKLQNSMFFVYHFIIKTGLGVVSKCQS